MTVRTAHLVSPNVESSLNLRIGRPGGAVLRAYPLLVLLHALSSMRHLIWPLAHQVIHICLRLWGVRQGFVVYLRPLYKLVFVQLSVVRRNIGGLLYRRSLPLDVRRLLARRGTLHAETDTPYAAMNGPVDARHARVKGIATPKLLNLRYDLRPFRNELFDGPGAHFDPHS